MLTPTMSLGQSEGSYLNRPEFWFEAGWPEIVTNRPGQLDPARCGPVVAAMVMDAPQGSSLLQIWLMDRKMAGEFDPSLSPRSLPWTSSSSCVVSRASGATPGMADRGF